MNIVSILWFTIVGFYAGVGFGACYNYLEEAVDKSKWWLRPLALLLGLACWGSVIFIADPFPAVFGSMAAAAAGIGMGLGEFTPGRKPTSR